MDSDWVSPRQRAGGAPQRNRVKQLKDKFETPQVQQGSQRQQTPKREKVPELRKKFEHSDLHAGGSGAHSHQHGNRSEAGSEQPYHDETEYVDMLKTIVEQHQENVSSLQREIQELEELVDDLSCDRLSTSGGSSGRASGQGMFGERRGTYTASPKNKDTRFTQPTTGGPSTSRQGANAGAYKPRSYTGSEIDRIIFEKDFDDYYDSDESDPEFMPPGRNESAMEDDVFYPGVSPKGFKHQRPLLAARHEMAKHGRPHSQPNEVMNHPGYSKKQHGKTEPTRKKEEEEYAYPLRQDRKGNTAGPTQKGTYTAQPTQKGTYKKEPTQKGTYKKEPTRKGTYTAEPTRKGTYKKEPTRKGTYKAEPTRKGTYTAEPTRKGTYKKEPTRKGTYTAEPSRRGTYTATPKGDKNRPINDGTVKVDPHTPYNSMAANNTLQKTVTLRSPGRDDTIQYDINIRPRKVSQSASGEHVICDIEIEMQENLPTYKFGHSTPPITPSSQRDSTSTPKSVFTKHNFAMRNLFDAERESPKHHSPKNNTIEWENPEDSPKNRTFEIKPQTSHTLNKTFTPEQNPEGEDEEDEPFQPPHHSSPSQSYGNRTFEDSPQWKQKDQQNDRTFRESPQNAYGGGGGRNDRTFEGSPPQNDRTFRESPQNAYGGGGGGRNDRTFEGSPPKNDRTFRESPQNAYGGGGGRNDRTFEGSPPKNDRTFRESPQNAYGGGGGRNDRTFEGSPPKNDRTFRESPQNAYGGGGGRNDRTFEGSPPKNDRTFRESPQNAYGGGGGRNDRTFEGSPPQNDRTFRESPQNAYGGGGGRNDRTFEDSPQWANRTYEVSENESEEESEAQQLNKTFDA